MQSGPGEQYDFFLSRRGSVAPIAREVTDVLTEKGYKVLVQDYDIPLSASFVEAMHEAIVNSRDLIILLTEDYLRSPYTRKEFTSFEAERVKTAEERHIIVLRCEDVPLRGLLADNVYQTLVGIEDREERKRRIIAAAERQSQAAPPPPRPFIGVPPRIASFKGRVDELDRLDAILMHGKPAALMQALVGRAAVQGMGGVGKTALAVEYAHRFRGLYAGICWCPAETRTGVLSALAGLAEPLRLQTANKTDVEKAARAVLNRLAEQRATWLLVYDNVSSPDEIADLLPSSGARVLITSRFSDWAGLADEMAVDVLPPKEAAAFLQSRTGRSDLAGANVLAEALGHLPLALDHAAAYCKRTQMRFADYAATASSLIATAPRGSNYPKSVAATFDLAISQAVSQCASAEPLMAYLAQCAPERVPMLLVEGAIDEVQERLQALTALSEVSLVKHDPFDDGTEALSTHRLVQSAARARMQSKGLEQNAIDRVIERLAAIYPKDVADPRYWPLCAQLTSHLFALRRSFGETLTNAHWPVLLLYAGDYLSERGAYLDAVSTLREALTIYEKVVGPENRGTAVCLNDLARALKGQGDFAGARLLFERALAITEKELGPDHPEVATRLTNLADLLQRQGNLAAARVLHERALAICDNALGPEHPSTAMCEHNLATALQREGELTMARLHFEHALAILEKARGPEHRYTMGCINNLAFVLRDQGDLAGARLMFERALALREKVLGPEHPDTAGSLSDLAYLLQVQGDLAVSRRLHERALAIKEKVLGSEHPDTATSLYDLACLLQDQSDLAGARLLFERALSIREKVLGPEHRDTAKSLNRLATLYAAQRDYASARPLSERELAVSEKAFGPEHGDTAQALSNLALVLVATGNLAEARPLFERALMIREKVLGKDHRDTNRTRYNLSRLLFLNNQLTDALKLGEIAVATNEKALGQDHPWTKDSARVTADTLDALGRAEEAMAMRDRYGLAS